MPVVADTMNLYNPTASGTGTWSSSDTNIAVVNATTGFLTCKKSGVTVLRYSMSGSCMLFFATDTLKVKSGIQGHTKICLTDTTRLIDSLAAGTWTSSNASIATVNSSTGLVKAMAIGNAAITYTFSRFGVTFFATDTMKVRAIPSIGTVIGPSSICSGTSVQLIDTVTNLYWQSSDTSIALFHEYSVDTNQVQIIGRSAGTVLIKYISNYCTFVADSTNFTVRPTPYSGVISPSFLNICPGDTASYTVTGADTAGVWRVDSGLTIVSSSVSSCVVRAIHPGSFQIIGYIATYSSGCSYETGSFAYIWPYPDAGTLSGPVNVVVGTSAAYTSSVSGGTWSISSASIATVTPSGFLNSYNIGTAILTYTVYGACGIVTSRTFAINITPPFISATSALFTGYINPYCAAPSFGASLSAHTSAYRLKTYFGDGSSDTLTIAPSTSTALTTFSHTYMNSGTYSIRQLLYNGSTAIDSVSYSYEQLVCHNIHLSFYHDFNSNCVYDTSTDNLNYAPVTIRIDSNGIPVDTISTISGVYYPAMGPSGTVYGFRVLSSVVSMSCPSSGVLYDTLSSGVYGEGNKMIALYCPGSGFDVSEYSTAKTGRHHQEIKIAVGNNYCTQQNATLTVRFSPRYNYQGAYPTPSSVVGNTLTWNLTHISNITGTHRNITIGIEVPGAWITPGDTVHTDIAIVPTGGGDLDTTNNNQTRIDTVKSSYDPNHIAVSPEGNILNGTKLRFALQFENDGNDTAENIYVMDTLSDYLDPSTFRIVSATAVMHTTMLTGGGHNIIKFDFPHIKLPDSSHHNQCTGMVLYDVNARTGIADGSMIYSHAGIYFDDNPVVLTDTARNRILIPAVTISSPTSDTICHGAVKHFTATPYSVNTPHYQWFVNTTAVGTDSVGFTTHSVGIGDVVKCRMTTTMDDTILSNSNTINISERMLSPGVISGLSVVCPAASITLSDSIAGGTWSARNSRATVSSGGIVTGVTAGIDTIVYTVHDVCATSIAIHPVTINPLPNAGHISGSAMVCLGATTALTDSTTGGTWSVTNTRATISSGGVVNGITAGLDTIIYSVTNYCGTATASHTITINNTTTPSDSIWVTRDSVCAGDTVTFTVIPTNGGSSPTFQWMRFSTMIDTGMTFTYIPTLGDVITCKMTSSAVCPVPAIVTSNAITMMVTPVVTPTVSIVATPGDSVAYIGQLITFYATATYGGSPTLYQWYENGTPVSGATSSTFATHVSSNDTVYCVITSNVPCATSTTASSNTIVIYADYLGIYNIQSFAGSFMLYPNPNNGNLTLSGKVEGSDALHFEVTDATAKLITMGTIQPNGGRVNQSINLDNAMPSGNYFVRIVSSTGAVVLRFVKE